MSEHRARGYGDRLNLIVTSTTWVLTRIAWIATALILAVGAAGLVTALDHRPGTPARAELTYAADQAVRGPLDAIEAGLDPIALDFDALSAQGRAALANLVAAHPDALDATLKAGATLVTKIGVETAAVRDRIAALPGTGPGEEGRLSSDLLLRITTVSRALDSTTGIAESWATLSSGASVATHLMRLLSQHDEVTGEAVQQGSQGKYREAVQLIGQAEPVLVQAGVLRDILGNAADVSTLTQWLDRNAAIDRALRRLYTELATSGGKVTDEAREAYEEVKVAQAQLPPDTRALVVIMSDLARAGLNQAVIKIEQGRGRLAEAIDLLRAPAGPTPTPGPEESAEPETQESLPPGGSGEPGGSSAPGSTEGPAVTPPDA